jgi:hypothetical protein
MGPRGGGGGHRDSPGAEVPELNLRITPRTSGARIALNYGCEWHRLPRDCTAHVYDVPYVQVVAKDMPGALIAKVQQQQLQQQQQAAGSRRGGAASAAAGAAGAAAGAAARPVDAEQVLRTAKREMLRDALELAVTSTVNHPHIVQVG